MLARSITRLFYNLVREVDPRGFVGDFRQLRHVTAPSTQRLVHATLQENANTIFCGHYHTGKLTLLKALGLHCEKKLGLRVAYVSADNNRANRLDGYLLHHFIGIRLSRDELPSQEQLEGTLERHARLVRSTYAGAFPSLYTADVLILDALEKVDPVVFSAMEAVSRRLRGQPQVPFGGLRVFAAADFFRMPVHPHSDTGGYLYQLDNWAECFPRQHLLRRTHGQARQLNTFTEKALLGKLTVKDMEALEALSAASPVHQATPPASQSSEPADDEEHEHEGSGELHRDEAEDGEQTPATSSADEVKDDVLSNVDALTRFTPRFPKQPTVRVMPTRYRLLKRTEMGHFLVNLLVQSSMPSSFGLVDALSVEVGSRVHLLLDGTAAFGVPAGAVGEVMQVKPHSLTVHFTASHRTVDIPRMRVVCYHPQYPEVRYELQQFPLFPRQRLCPLSILSHANAYHISLNGRRMADTNDLGNILARMRSFKDFGIRNTADYVHLDGMVHEPTRIYYHWIMQQPLSDAAEQWCRNCKAFIPREKFFEHWSACVRETRWCAECSKTIPLPLLEPHREKHQVVLCMDCGQGVEWRHWEAHRLTCGAMMREISPDNVFLPLRTRQLALELGLDKRDLHTMRNFSKAMLPKSRLQVR